MYKCGEFLHSIKKELKLKGHFLFPDCWWNIFGHEISGRLLWLVWLNVDPLQRSDSSLAPEPVPRGSSDHRPPPRARQGRHPLLQDGETPRREAASPEGHVCSQRLDWCHQESSGTSRAFFSLCDWLATFSKKIEPGLEHRSRPDWCSKVIFVDFQVKLCFQLSTYRQMDSK